MCVLIPTITATQQEINVLRQSMKQEIDKGNKVEMTFLTPYLDGIARWLLMFTNSIRIHSPKSLIPEINQLIDELKINYK